MNRVMIFLTKIDIRFLNGRYVRTQVVKIPDGREQEIMVLSGQNTLFAGQCTIFRTIIINESVLDNGPRFNYVITHEMAHKDQWWGYLFYPLALLVIGSLFLLAMSIYFLIQFVTSIDVYYLVGFLAMLSLAAAFFIIPCAFSWLMELNADFKAINVLGLQTFIKVFNVRPKNKLSTSQKIIIRITHPTQRLTISLWKRFHDKPKDTLSRLSSG